MTTDKQASLFTALVAQDAAMTPEQRRQLVARTRRLNGLHAAPVGSGPQGETCGSCKHLYRRTMAKTYLKCGLCQAKWSGGGGTDVKSRDPACSKWESNADANKA